MNGLLRSLFLLCLVLVMNTTWAATINYTLTVTKIGTGAVTSAPTGINCGTTCSKSYSSGTTATLTAAIASGDYVFTGWSGACNGTTATCTLTMNSAKTVTATFTRAYTLSVTKDGMGSGRVTSVPAGMDCGTICNKNFLTGTSVTLIAAALTGSSFARWSGACTGTSSTCTVAMTAAKSVKATFNALKPSLYTLTVCRAGNGSVASLPAGITCGTDCTENYSAATAVTLTATPDPSNNFTGWSGTCSGTGKCTVRMNANTSVTANFAPIVVGTINPILFVTQVPTASFNNVAAAFGSHKTDPQSAPRGGDLWIRYTDGSLRNLTKEAGYGVDGAQDSTNAIAVRQPVVHWSGAKALFAMLVGNPSRQYQVTSYRWQLYEVSGFLQGQTVTIQKVPCQPASYNNIAQAYGSDDQIIFTSDQPRNGAPHLYPQLDEYESAVVESGLWKLNTNTCTVRIIEHTPSGVTYPTVDSTGRVIVTKWDHLQRDQQADQDQFNSMTYGTFNYDSEEQTTPPITFSVAEYFPELRRAVYSLSKNGGYDGVHIASDYPFSDFTFNHFFPWMINQDGSEEETLNHVGRHELGGIYSSKSYRADPALADIQFGVFNKATVFIRGDGGMFHIKEDPKNPGRFYSTYAPEFATATADAILRLNGQPGLNPEQMQLEQLSVKEQSGRMRNPLPLSNGQLVVVHTPTAADLANTGTSTAPVYNYDFRLRTVKFVNGVAMPDVALTGGIQKAIQYWDPDQRVSWQGSLWELDPVEVLARPVPAKTKTPNFPTVETGILAGMGISQDLLRNWLHARNLALIVTRNVTTRDRADKTQPYNLRVVGSNTQTIGSGIGPIYPVSHLQLFQADQLRGYTSGQPPQNGGTPRPGRRVLAVPMHDSAAVQAMGPLLSTVVQGAVPIAADGSVAAFVPAGRAMVWQLIDAAKTDWSTAVVRERNWLSFQRGETRVCGSCHGVNTQDQAGSSAPNNSPQALTTLLTQWVRVVRNNCPVSGGTGSWSYAGVMFSGCEDGRSYRIQTCQGGSGCCDGLPGTEIIDCL